MTPHFPNTPEEALIAAFCMTMAQAFCVIMIWVRRFQATASNIDRMHASSTRWFVSLMIFTVVSIFMWVYSMYLTNKLFL